MVLRGESRTCEKLGHMMSATTISICFNTFDLPCIIGIHCALYDRLDVNRKQELCNLQNLSVGTTNDVKSANNNVAEVVKESRRLEVRNFNVLNRAA